MPGFTVLHRTIPFHDRTRDEAVFVALFGAEPTAFWLDSAGGPARFSFMGGAFGRHGLVVSHRVSEGTVRSRSREGAHTVQTDFFAWLSGAIAARRVANAAELPFDLACGFVGYLGYELKAYTGGDAVHRSPHPDALFVLADRMLAFDHQAGTLTAVALVDGADAEAEAWVDAVLARAASAAAPPPPAKTHERLVLRWSRGRERYLADIATCMERLREGETYEVCLTDTLRAATRVSPLAFHRTLRKANPAPYAAFLRFDDVAVVSASPERFLAIATNGDVETRPIKGTAPRGATPEEDARLAEGLRTSEKTRSENLMVVDLLRNDLGVVCEVGSVHVPRLMHVETHPTLHQLVSTIRGRLRADVDAVACVRAAFPGGSMTGAPKIRTMHVLDRLETHARGVYSGALGYFSLGGAAELSIVIRTAVFARGEVTIGVGGAITALSDPRAEHDEIVLKARALVRALHESCGEGAVAARPLAANEAGATIGI